MQFHIHISRNFKGGQYFTSFEATSGEEVLSNMKDAWYRAAITNETGEAFLVIDGDDPEEKQVVSTFVFYKGTELSWEMNLDDPDVEEKWAEMGYKVDLSLYNEELLFDVVNFLLARD
jgi:hypothetical protein